MFWIRILSRAWSGSISALCSIGWGQSLRCILWYLGWARKSKKALLMCFEPLYFSLWTFFFNLCVESGLPHGHFKAFRTSYVPSHFQKTTLQEVKEDTADLRLSCRSYTQSLLVHSIGQNSS